MRRLRPRTGAIRTLDILQSTMAVKPASSLACRRMLRTQRVAGAIGSAPCASFRMNNVEALVGSLCRAGVRARQALHRLGRIRPAARAARHPRLARARAHAARVGHPVARRPARDRTRACGNLPRNRLAENFAWSLDAEDVHLNIERRLIALVGDAGKRLHTARSRNDQVATDVRLWLRDAIDAIASLLQACRPRCSIRPNGTPAR